MSADEPTARVTLDLEHALAQQVERAAAARRESVATFCLSAIQERVAALSGRDSGLDDMTSTADPVLAELWDNERDAAYDSLPSR